MALMEWSPTFSVKVKKFDDQHKKLVDLVNQLHDAMKAGQGNVALGAILQQLINYTATHFKDEEQVMQANGYPDLAKHKTIHADLVKQVLDLQKKFQTGEAGGVLTMKVLSFLKDWLVTHIQGEDKKYGVYLNTKGIS
jgi:hemerythrin